MGWPYLLCQSRLKRWLIRQQHLQPRVFIAEKRLALHVAFVADDDAQFLRARERLEFFLENQQLRSFGRVAKLKIRFRRNKSITARGQVEFFAAEPRAAFAGENVIKMFQHAGVARAAAVFAKRDLQLRETRAVHHRREVDNDDGVFPADPPLEPSAMPFGAPSAEKPPFPRR